MNYLAHLYLAYPDHGLMVGNFIADAVKGHDYEVFPERIKQGIIMHRSIDDFTDHHPLVLDSKRYFSKEFDKYSGVLIDIYFDYFLAKNFALYSDASLSTFASNTYSILTNNKAVFPERSVHFFDYMIKENILERYAELDGMNKVLHGMTYRIKERFPLYESLSTFKEKQGILYNNFVPFFEELKLHVAHFRK